VPVQLTFCCLDLHTILTSLAGYRALSSMSCTPVCVACTQVTKDASMLEAFGKGASEEMQMCKRVIQEQVRYAHD
jgi:hypothetical protein